MSSLGLYFLILEKSDIIYSAFCVMAIYFSLFGCARYQVFSNCDDENTNNASEKPETKDGNLYEIGSEDAQPVSNKISSTAVEQGARSSETEKDPEGDKNQASSCDISEAMIKKAIDKRASYFRENSEYVSPTCKY
jgi:hypothetical protein